MTFTEIVAKEQVLKSLLQEAESQIALAESSKHNIINKKGKDEIDNKITEFRKTVVTPIRTAISELRNEKYEAAGINNNFNWD